MKNVMKKTLVAAALLVPFVSNAAVTTITDQTAWEGAVSPTGMYNFTGDTSNVSFSSKDFGAFTLSNEGTGANPYVSTGKKIAFTANDGEDGLKASFDDNISAFGFTWRNEDPGNDQIVLSVLGMDYDLGSGSSGFFGIIADTVFMDLLFGDDTGHGGGILGRNANDKVRLDDFQWANNIAADESCYGEYCQSPGEVPVPAAVWLFGSGLVGFMGLRRKSKLAVK